MDRSYSTPSDIARPQRKKKPSSHPNKEMSLERRRQVTTSSGELLSIPKQSPWHPLEESPPNIKDTERCSVKKNCRGYLDTPSGTTPLNCSRGPPHRYPDDSSRSPKARLPKRKSS